MLKRLNSRLALLAIAAVIVPATSHASDGTITINGKIAGTTCAVTTANISVNLDPVPATQFTGPGVTAGAKDFDIGLNCTGIASTVYMTLTDQSSAMNRTDKLTLPAGVAEHGVRIQLLRAGSTTPISYGSDTAGVGGAGHENQFTVGTAADVAAAGNVVKLTARYIQDAASVTIGDVVGNATFTMAYQ